jgi:hypothetical protein
MTEPGFMYYLLGSRVARIVREGDGVSAEVFDPILASFVPEAGLYDRLVGADGEPGGEWISTMRAAELLGLVGD